MSSAGQVVVQLIVDSSGAKVGTDAFNASMKKSEETAKSTSQSIAGSYESVQKRWQNSLAATDPVLKAQMQMQQAVERQTLLGNRAVDLQIATHKQAAAQIEEVRQKHLALVDAAGKTQNGFLSLIGVESLLERAFVRLVAVMAAREIIEFGVHAFENAAALGEQAQQVGVSVEAFQAYRGAMLVSGIATDQADQIISKLTRNIGTAVDKAGPARDAFNELGISFQTLKGGAESALPAVAQALLNVQDVTERARLEVDLFGKTGQKLESALRALADPTTTLIEKQKALGLVMGEELTKAADDAADRVSVAWSKLEKSVGGVIVRTISAILDLRNALGELAGNNGQPSAMDVAFPELAADRARKAAAVAALAQAQANKAANPLGISDNQVVVSTGRAVGANDNGFSAAAMDKYISQQRISADLAGLSALRRSEEEASIAAANAKLEDGAAILYNQDGSVRKFVTSYKEAVGVIGQGTAKEVESLAATIARGKAWDKVRETVDQYLQQMDAEAAAAGKTALQRSIDTDIIKAGEISQKARGVIEKDINKTLAGNTNELSQQKTKTGQMVIDAITMTDTNKILAPIEKQIGDQLELSALALTTSREERQLALQIKQQELSTGAKLLDQDVEDLKVTQQRNDATRMKDYLEDLRTELKLAGMSADEREREYAAIQAGRNRATSAQQDQIRGLIAARQETERWRQVVDDISNGFQGFFEDVLNNGKLSFQSLWDSIKQSFVRMLAYMATQALVSPIIIPMVEGFAGTLGVSTGLGGGGGASGALSSLSSLGSIGSLFSGGGGGLLGGLFGGGGAALGGAGVQAQILAASGLPAGFSTAAGGSLLGGLSTGNGLLGSLGGGFTGFLGGAGIGALASSLIFGNKNDASLGGLGGAAAGAAIGSIIPGVGTILGGLIGGLAGGGLGSITGSSNQGAISNFTDNGLGNTLFKAGGGNNGQMATTASGTINKALQALKDAGVDVSLGNISGLSIGSDKSYVYDFAGGKQKLAGGEAGVQATVNAILDRILPSATGSDDSTNAILQKYRDNGGINASNITQLAQDLQAAKSAADNLKAQVDAFGPGITAAIKKITNPTGAAFDDLITAQKSRLKQAEALSVDVTQLTTLNDAELNQFMKGLTTAQKKILAADGDISQSIVDLSQGFDTLTGSIGDMISQAQDASKTASQIANAWGGANTSLTKASQALLISAPGLSPVDQYRNSRSQFDALRSSAFGGSSSAANEIASFASQFLQTSFQFNGSTQAYGGDLGYVRDTLNGLAGFSKTQQDLAQQQADSMSQAVNLLQIIAKGISDGTDSSSADLQELTAQVADLTTQVKNVGLFNRTMAA